MAQIFLIRHGRRLSIEYNSGLSEEGKIQAKYLSNRFKNTSFTKIYVSTIERASETAKSIVIHHKKTPIISTDLFKEVHASLIGGKIGNDIGRARKDRKRANQAFNKIFMKAKKQDRILVICHGNIIKYFINKVLHTPKLDLWHNLHMNSAAVTLIEGYKNEWTIKTINNVDHFNNIYKKYFYEKEYERPV